MSVYLNISCGNIEKSGFYSNLSGDFLGNDGNFHGILAKFTFKWRNLMVSDGFLNI